MPGPETTDPRTALVDAALRVLDREGRGALSARSVAAEYGSSTMVVYHHFGSMPALLKAVAERGVDMLEAAMDARRRRDDPIEDMAASAAAYHSWALRNPIVYEFMYGPGTPLPIRRLDPDFENPTVTERTLLHLVLSIQKAMDAGALRTANPVNAGRDLWVALHGFVVLQFAGVMTDPDDFRRIFGRIAGLILVGLGGERDHVRPRIDRGFADD